jgi:hypothetical protein
MTAAMFTCPRCLYSAERAEALRFCPRCGLADGAVAAEGPTRVSYDGGGINVWEGIAFGDVANLYRWTVEDKPGVGVFKVARTHLSNRHIVHEAQVLKQLHAADDRERFTPFLPRVVRNVIYGSAASEPVRSASILAYHPDIPGPDDLYSLDEVRRAHPMGIEARDMAWMWRRVLTILGFVHQQRIVHGCVTPDHVLIEPKGHKMVLIGWAGSAHFGTPAVLEPERWKGWSKWDGGASPATDLAAAARTMRYILQPDGEEAIARHLERAGEANGGDAWKLLDDFDRLIEALWGPRSFRPFAMSRMRPLGKEQSHG